MVVVVAGGLALSLSLSLARTMHAPVIFMMAHTYAEFERGDEGDTH